MSYLNVSIEPGERPGEYTAEPSNDTYEDPEELIENMTNAGVRVFELGIDNLPPDVDIRRAIDIPPERVFLGVPDELDGRPFYFGITTQH